MYSHDKLEVGVIGRVAQVQRAEFISGVNIEYSAASSLFSYAIYEEPRELVYYLIDRLLFLDVAQSMGLDGRPNGHPEYSLERLMYDRRDNIYIYGIERFIGHAQDLLAVTLVYSRHHQCGSCRRYSCVCGRGKPCGKNENSVGPDIRIVPSVSSKWCRLTKFDELMLERPHHVFRLNVPGDKTHVLLSDKLKLNPHPYTYPTGIILNDFF